MRHGEYRPVKRVPQSSSRFEDVRDAAMTSEKRMFQPHLVRLGDDQTDFLETLGEAKLAAGFDGDDRLTGSARAEALIGGRGNDTLEGGGGRDRLTGGPGDDTYVDPIAATILEAVGGGVDTVTSARTFSLAGHANVERLVLTGTAQINGTGNGLSNELTGNSAANRLEGGAGADTLEGGGGIDTLIGGAGNDTYVNPTGDVIQEATNGGADTVTSSTHFSLAGLANVENLTLTGTANVNATGSSSGNVIWGNDGDNRLRGNGGADTMNGGDGADVFVYGGALDSAGLRYDTIMDMDLDGVDRFDFELTPAAVAQITSGRLGTATFSADIAAAVDAHLAPSGAVLFDPSSGNLDQSGHQFLIVDANGDGVYSSGADYVIRLIDASGQLTQDDFI